jgi:mRNA-degrading endonuclease RelE of RelBE toxin-antitoxin system
MAKPEYEIQLSAIAEATYTRMHQEAQECIERGDHTNSKVTQFNMVEEALGRIIPHDPFVPERSLSGALSGIYRIKKGRMRICYVGNSIERVIRILYISETPRKDGDSNDPYRILTRWIRSGNNELLSRLGVSRPLRRTDRDASS